LGRIGLGFVDWEEKGLNGMLTIVLLGRSRVDGSILLVHTYYNEVLRCVRQLSRRRRDWI
jgi:hypothetical protein